MDSFKISKEQYCDLMKLDRTNAVNLFLYLLANADDKGTLIVSIRKISSELCIGVRTVRTLLKKMYATHQVTQLLTHQVTHKGSMITICDAKSYIDRRQVCDTPSDTVTDTPSDTQKVTKVGTVDVTKAEYCSLFENAAEGRYFEDEQMNNAILQWLAYKKEKKQSYKPKGLEMLKKKIQALSNGNGDIAMQIVEQSMSNNYSGLFPLKGVSTKSVSSALPVGMNLQNSNNDERYKLDDRWNK